MTKQDEVGEVPGATESGLPPGWVTTSIGEVATEKVSQDGPSGTTFTYVDISSIDNKTKRIVDPKILPTTGAPSRARQRLSTGDVLVSMTRPNLNAVGILPATLDGAVGSTGFDVLRTQYVEPVFLFYLVQSNAFIDTMTALVQGALYPAVRPKDIRAYRFALPPLSEQRRIVAEIEERFSLIDAAVASLKRAQANLKRYRASVLQAACTGRLVPTEAELARAEGRDYEPADVLLQRILAERRARWEADQLAKMKAQGKTPKDDRWKAKYEEPKAPDTNSLHELPEGWTWTLLGQAFSVYVGATPSRKVAQYWGGDIPWVSSGEVAFCRISDTREKITASGLANTSTDVHPTGTVLLGMIGEGRTRGQVAILNIPACNNQNCAAVRVSETPIPSEYVYHYLEGQYAETRRNSSGNNQPALNKTSVSAMAIPLPPLAEQQRIVTEVERLLSVTENLETTLAANLMRADRLKQSILRDAFAGRLVPQDPTDEPASVLLERIRAERAALSPASARSAPRRRGDARKEKTTDGRHDEDDAAGARVPPGVHRRKQDAPKGARLQPDLFSEHGP